MSKKPAPTDKFFENSDLDLNTVTSIVRDGLSGADYGEFYQEINEGEALVKDKGEYVTVSVGNSNSGFGFRIGQEERVGYAYSDIFNKASLKKAVKDARNMLQDATPAPQKPFGRIDQELYPQQNPMENMTLEEKIAGLDAIEAYAKSLDPNIVNVTLSYGASVKSVHIVTPDGQSLVDNRPMASLNITLTVTDPATGKTESGYTLMGGRVDCTDVFNEAAYKAAAQRALKQAQELLIADDAPAGVMDVVLAPGWAAVILHEAVGHGLEGDFNRRNISVYSGKLGQQVAAPEVTVIDQGDMPGERGSIHFDDEGTPTQQNVLIEKGVLKGYMQDRQNAQLMGDQLTGNGRRENYSSVPMPRMTNTYFQNGTHDPEDIIKSVKDGLYISDMGGGQVDITSGKFSMNATLAYRIRDGKICEPVKGVMLIGDGLTVIKSIKMVGNDLKIEKSAGACGKNGQRVTVSSGQPTISVANMTVGGTKKPTKGA